MLAGPRGSAFGVGRSFSAPFSVELPRPNVSDSLSPSDAVGVGSNGEEPLTEVRGTDGCCWKHIPDKIETDRGQVCIYLSGKVSGVPSRGSEIKEIRDVLHEHVSGSKLANGSEHLSPQNGFGVAEALSLSGRRDSLAGEAAGDDIDSSSRSCSDGSDIVEDGDAGEALFEDRTAPGVDLAEPGVFEAGEVEAEGEKSNSVELAADAEVDLGIHSTPDGAASGCSTAGSRRIAEGAWGKTCSTRWQVVRTSAGTSRRSQKSGGSSVALVTTSQQRRPCFPSQKSMRTKSARPASASRRWRQPFGGGHGTFHSASWSRGQPPAGDCAATISSAVGCLGSQP
ncbi:MAG TPA: hypothetical protein VMS60_15960 [Solirubrobacterales bacterium]|nr:hypothetical protein [Solirubrobacterales bacterium]